MIYLIDDKKERQENDYGWSLEKILEYKGFLEPIYSLKTLEDNNEKIFGNAQVIIYHESFIDKSTLSKKAVEKREKIINYGKKNDISVVFFSGGSDTRSLNGNIANLSDSILYQNLDVFLKAYEKGEINLNYLLFGADPEMDKKLRKKLKEKLKLADNEAAMKLVNPKKNLFLRPLTDYISNPIQDIITEKLWDVSNNYFNEFVEEKLKYTQYHNIFIPLCFGQTLSDFNGLRLATFIRCTKSINQLSNIFIYSFTGLENFFENEYVNILKTKNVELVDYKKTAFQEAVLKPKEQLKSNELTVELNKLNLKVPGSYFDSHHIANEWGIYQVARNANLNIDDIEGFDKEKLNSIYFKWLIAKNDLYKKLPEKQIEEQKRYADELPGPKIVGKIDIP